jgi:hypothetical protein
MFSNNIDLVVFSFSTSVLVAMFVLIGYLYWQRKHKH